MNASEIKGHTWLLDLAPVDWEKTADAMTEAGRDAARRTFEGLAERAATLSVYLDERAGHGCGDQGHTKAMKKANRAGRVVWCKAFGYNDHHALTV